jgi:hypothetical protein
MQRARRTPIPDDRRPTGLAAVGEPDDGALDWADVPAAVVCAVCGKPDCSGCLAVEEPTNASGVVAIMPWERPGLGWLTRLWATARVVTLSHRDLFAALPEGSLRPALAFACVAELTAALGLGVCFSLVLALAPDFASTLLHDPYLRSLLVKAFVGGVPGLAALMIALHALHGVLVDRAARLAGSRKRGRGLRFGLYACGWDLVTLPLGLLIVVATEGFGTARRAAGLAVSVPVQATRAYLTGVHALDPHQARKAAQRANVETGVSSLALLVLVVVVVVLASR